MEFEMITRREPAPPSSLDGGAVPRPPAPDVTDSGDGAGAEGMEATGAPGESLGSAMEVRAGATSGPAGTRDISNGQDKGQAACSIGEAAIAGGRAIIRHRAMERAALFMLIVTVLRPGGYIINLVRRLHVI